MTDIETQVRNFAHTLEHVAPVRAHDVITDDSLPMRSRRRTRRVAMTLVTSIAVVSALLVLLLATEDDAGRDPSVAASATPGWSTLTDAAHGLSISYPPSWQAAPSTLTPALIDPVVPIALGTYPLEPERSGECDIVPQRALEAMGPMDAFVAVYVFQGTGASFSPTTERPDRFGPELPWSGGSLPERESGGGIQCTQNVRGFVGSLSFDDHGKHLSVMIGIGPQASADTHNDVYRILDTLTVTG